MRRDASSGAAAARGCCCDASLSRVGREGDDGVVIGGVRAIGAILILVNVLWLGK